MTSVLCAGDPVVTRARLITGAADAPLAEHAACVGDEGRLAQTAGIVTADRTLPLPLVIVVAATSGGGSGGGLEVSEESDGDVLHC